MLKRVNYFDGQFLRPKDFIDEQTYQIELRQKHNSLLHTWGVADGLVPSADKGASRVKVSPGFAIDILGHEIEVDDEGLSPDLKNFSGKSPFVTIAWNETPTDKSTEAGTVGDTRVAVTPIIALTETPIRGQQLVLGQVTVDAQGGFQSVDASSGVRTMAGARAGDLTAISLSLTGLNIDPSQQPRLSVTTAAQVDLKGGLQINGNLGVTGTVGFGTTTPAQRLDVVGGIGFSGTGLNAQDKKLYAPADGDLEWMTNNAAGAHGFAVSQQGAKAVYLNTSGSSYLNGGNVGIGTTTPAQRLDVVGGIGFSGTGLNAKDKKLYAPADGDLEWETNNGAGSHGFAISNQGTKAIYLNTSGNSYLTGGNVGIGTTSPATKLHLNLKIADDNAKAYDANALMVVHPTPSAAATLNDPKDVLYLGRQGTSGQAYGAMATYKLSRYENAGTSSRTRLDLALTHDAFNDTTVMTFLSSGNVGIGTATPGYKLEVNGVVSAPAFIASNPMNDRMYPSDALIYQEIFAARDSGAIRLVGNAPYDDHTYAGGSLWARRHIIKFGSGNDPDGSGALVTIPAGYTTVWVRVLGDRWNVIKAKYADGAAEDVGTFIGGLRSLNSYCPDGSTADGCWIGDDAWGNKGVGVVAHQWVPIPAGRPGQLVLTSKPSTSHDFWISGLAFSRNPWGHATQHALGYPWAVNGGVANAVAWDNANWNRDVLSKILPQTKPLLKVPVVPTGRDKLLYAVDHNDNWACSLHVGITVNGEAIERFVTTYDNPFARHWNSKFYERYLAARIPARLTQGLRFLDVQIDMMMQDNSNFYFREMGTHDFQVPGTV